MNPFFIKYSRSIAWILFFSALVYCPLFLHLGNLAVRRYDEARLAISAYEMNKNGNYLIPHFQGAPDLWNTKPPLMIWAQVFCIKLFGFNELGVRLPSALAALFTCILLFVFCYRFFQKPVLGIIAVGILITSPGFIGNHLSRTGDYDPMLTLFTTAYILCFFIVCESDDKKIKNRFLGLFFLCLTLATLTKGIAGLLFTPALFIFSVVRKQFVPLLKNKKTYLYFSGFLATIVSYYMIRENMNPGYINAVKQNELGGRYLQIIEGHREGPLFYFDFIIDTAFKHWYLFVLPGIALSLVSKHKRMKNLSWLLLLTSFTFVIILSNSQTKIYWYAMPVFPLLALSAGLFFYWLFEVLKNLENIFPPAKRNIVPHIMLFLVFWTPYNHILDAVYKPGEKGKDKEFYSIGYYLRDAVQGKRNISGSYILYEKYHAEIDFYILQLEEKNQTVKFKTSKDVSVNDTVIVHENDLKKFIEENFETEVLEEFRNVSLYRVISKCD